MLPVTVKCVCVCFFFSFFFFNFEWHCRSVRTASIPAFAAIVENVTDKTVSDKSSFLYVMFVVDGIFFLESSNRIITLSFALRLKVSKCCIHFSLQQTLVSN